VNASESQPTSFVTIRGIRFAYTATGVGPVVLNAHGLTASRANDARLGVTDFSPVAASGRTLISYDARGHGETQGSRDPADYTWASLAEDMIALVNHFSPNAPVSAIGSSMGTGTLLHAVTQEPARFDRLVLTAPPTAWETRSGQGTIYRQMAEVVASSMPELLAAMTSQAPVPAIFADLPAFPPAPDVDFSLLPTIFQGATHADLLPLETLSRITQPTLILAWATDPGHPVSTADKLHRAVSGSILRVSDTSADIRSWGQLAANFLTLCENL
jgi:3-oxoadipate enol-lactonase